MLSAAGDGRRITARYGEKALPVLQGTRIVFGADGDKTGARPGRGEDSEVGLYPDPVRWTQV